MKARIEIRNIRWNSHIRIVDIDGRFLTSRMGIKSGVMIYNFNIRKNKTIVIKVSSLKYYQYEVGIRLIPNESNTVQIKQIMLPEEKEKFLALRRQKIVPYSSMNPL